MSKIVNDSGIVPSLRFQGFDGAWEVKNLIDICGEGLSNGVFNDPTKVGRGYKIVNVSDMYLDTYIDEENLNLVDIPFLEFSKNKVEKGDIFFTRSSLVKSGIAYSNIYQGNSENITFDGHLIRLKSNKKIIEPLFIHFLLKTSQVRTQLIARGKTATMTTIGQNDVAGISLTIPLSLTEQVKIASFLSSLDDLIALEGEKLESLKTHKKGLMQQLFPASGATTPALRFPEFERSGEWEVKKVGDIFKVTRGEVLSMTLVRDYKTHKFSYPVYSSQTKNNGLSGYYSDFLFENAITWTTDGANAGDVNYRQGKFYCTNVCGVLLNELGYANGFVAALINCVSRQYVSYVGNPKLMNGVMSEIPISLPSLAEQTKIASLLSALDNLITAQGEKIDTLKTYKKGLMQQLFPALEGSEP